MSKYQTRREIEDEVDRKMQAALSATVERLIYPLVKMNLLLTCVLLLLIYWNDLTSMLIDIANSLATKPVPK